MLCPFCSGCRRFQPVLILPTKPVTVAQVLLGSRFHGVFPGAAVADALDRHFLLHDFTPAALRKGLQVLLALGSEARVRGSQRSPGMSRCCCSEVRTPEAGTAAVPAQGYWNDVG